VTRPGDPVVSHMMHPSDAQVIAAVLRGDTGMYRHLVHRYQNVYRRYATRVLGSADDADDALQLAFVRAFRNLSSCRDPARFAGWLYQIVVNECRTFAARRTRRERRVAADDAQVHEAAAPQPTHGESSDVEEIHRALALLEHDQREAFVLKHVEELSYEEMAELTGAGVSALKMRVKRACTRLRELLEEVPHDR
jgi:RNA polymerase sigma-70 factor (ECF subfamily)